MMEMVDQGLVNLEETIDKYLPPFRGTETAAGTHCHDLYLHVTGLPEKFGDGMNDIEELLAPCYARLTEANHSYQRQAWLWVEKSLK